MHSWKNYTYSSSSFSTWMTTSRWKHQNQCIKPDSCHYEQNIKREWRCWKMVGVFYWDLADCALRNGLARRWRDQWLRCWWFLRASFSLSSSPSRIQNGSVLSSSPYHCGKNIWHELYPPNLSSDHMDYIVHGILCARMLEWIAFPFSRGSSQPRDWTQVSCIASRFFTSWAIREAYHKYFIKTVLKERSTLQLSTVQFA